MVYAEMERRLNDIPKFGAKASLDNLSSYLDILDHPERNLRVIHVAGTNGKGSVCAFLDSMLRAGGYRTALFTSPHLVTVRERFRIDGQMVSEEKTAGAFDRVLSLMEEGMEKGLGPLTYFEVLFLMSLLIFREEEIDYCIMETGLGGRLDATVLTVPVLCVITSISLDHTAVLGETIEEIAREKAGIIKRGIPVAVMEEDPGAFSVIKEVAADRNASLYPLKNEEIIILKKRKNYIDFSIVNRYYNSSRLRIRHRARYQVMNASLALLALHVLLPDFPPASVAAGLEGMVWPGRMEEIEDRIFVDGAHNPGAILRIRDQLDDPGDPDYGHWNLLFAVCEDKDYPTMIKSLAGIPFRRIYVTSMRTDRAAGAREIGKLFEESFSCPVFVLDSVREAYYTARQTISDEECLLCLGSLYLVGELKEMAERT